VSQCPCLPGPAVPSLGRLAGRSALPVLNAPASAPIGNPFARPLVAVSPFYLFILALLGDLRSRRPLGRLDPACQAWGRERERGERGEKSRARELARLARFTWRPIGLLSLFVKYHIATSETNKEAKIAYNKSRAEFEEEEYKLRERERE